MLYIWIMCFSSGNLVSWKSPKHVVARSSVETEIEQWLTTCDPVWIKQLFKGIKFEEINLKELVCDNQETLHIASNSVWHERTKHIEIDCHFVKEEILSGDNNRLGPQIAQPDTDKKQQKNKGITFGKCWKLHLLHSHSSPPCEIWS